MPVVYQIKILWSLRSKTRDLVFHNSKRILKKYVPLPVPLPLTTAHSQVGTLTFGSKAPDVYTAEESSFLWSWLSRSLSHSHALAFDGRPQASSIQLG